MMQRKTSHLKKVRFISSLFFISVAIFYLAHERFSLSRQDSADNFVTVVSVSDGDTVKVILNRRKEKVRLVGIDAPELGQRPWGTEAKKYLETLLGSSGWKVELEFDVEKRDKYGRVLAYLKTTDGKLINLLMVRNGYAMLFTIPPNVRYAAELRSAQREAREEHLGIWSSEGLGERPGDYRREHPRI
jgi:micrococcal nuclease